MSTQTDGCMFCKHLRIGIILPVIACARKGEDNWVPTVLSGICVDGGYEYDPNNEYVQRKRSNHE